MRIHVVCDATWYPIRAFVTLEQANAWKDKHPSKDTLTIVNSNLEGAEMLSMELHKSKIRQLAMKAGHGPEDKEPKR